MKSSKTHRSMIQPRILNKKNLKFWKPYLFIEIGVEFWLHAAHSKTFLAHGSKVMKHVLFLEHQQFQSMSFSNSWHMYVFRFRILWRTKNNQFFHSSPTQIFSNTIFSLMHKQKYYFDFQFRISVKFRVEWCITSYDLYWIYSFSLLLVYLLAYANTQSFTQIKKKIFKKSSINDSTKNFA